MCPRILLQARHELCSGCLANHSVHDVDCQLQQRTAALGSLLSALGVAVELAALRGVAAELAAPRGITAELAALWNVAAELAALLAAEAILRALLRVVAGAANAAATTVVAASRACRASLRYLATRSALTLVAVTSSLLSGISSTWCSSDTGWYPNYSQQLVRTKVQP